jgi:hypothetical protein
MQSFPPTTQSVPESFLGQLLKEAHPLASEIVAPLKQGYYWSAAETEYATDLLFDHPKRLADIQEFGVLNSEFRVSTPG